MAERNENVAKSVENPRENGTKAKEGHKASPVTNGKPSVDVKINGNSGETAKSIISQKPAPTPAHKSLHTSPHSPSRPTAAAMSSSNHVAPKSEARGRGESKTPHETPTKDKKKHDGHGKRRRDRTMDLGSDEKSAKTFIGCESYFVLIVDM